MRRIHFKQRSTISHVSVDQLFDGICELRPALTAKEAERIWFHFGSDDFSEKLNLSSQFKSSFAMFSSVGVIPHPLYKATLAPIVVEEPRFITAEKMSQLDEIFPLFKKDSDEDNNPANYA
jgi:hypothetical protein